MRVGHPRAHRAFVLAVLLASCSSGTTGPASGNLNVEFGSLHGDEGAVLFTVSGGPIETVQAVNGAVYTAQIDPNTTRVIVTGNLSSGPIARVRIADMSTASQYLARLDQVAVRSSYAPGDPGLYSLTLTH
jgi:hypothetical protein